MLVVMDDARGGGGGYGGAWRGGPAYDDHVVVSAAGAIRTLVVNFYRLYNLPCSA